jgi:cell division septation protein DedD
MNCNTNKLVSVAILAVLSLTFPMSAASAQTVIIADGSADAGATTTVTVTADDVTDLANFDITVTYDPAVVNVTAAANNAVFGSDTNNFEGASTGAVRLMSFNTGSGQTGDGILLSTLTLKALGTAGQNSALTLTTNSLMDSSEGDITATIDTGVFTVSSGTHPTPAPTVTPTSSIPSATPDTTATAANAAKPAPTETLTVEPAAPATGGDTTMPDAPAKKGLPGFEGAIAIAGLLTIAYMLMPRKQ